MTENQQRYWWLAQCKAAVRLEKLGLKHSSGRSVTAMVKRELNLPRSTKPDAVIAALLEAQAAILAKEVIDHAANN